MHGLVLTATTGDIMPDLPQVVADGLVSRLHLHSIVELNQVGVPSGSGGQFGLLLTLNSAVSPALVQLANWVTNRSKKMLLCHIK